MMHSHLSCSNYKLDIKDRVAGQSIQGPRFRDSLFAYFYLIGSDLVGRMALADKVSQLGTGATALSDLAIPAYQWYAEYLFNNEWYNNEN